MSRPKIRRRFFTTHHPPILTARPGRPRRKHAVASTRRPRRSGTHRDERVHIRLPERLGDRRMRDLAVADVESGAQVRIGPER